jgi:hypothetical protein
MKMSSFGFDVWRLLPKQALHGGRNQDRDRGGGVGDVGNVFGGPVSRLYRHSLEDRGIDVLAMSVFSTLRVRRRSPPCERSCSCAQYASS